MNRTRFALVVVAALLLVDVAMRLDSALSTAHAQTSADPAREPIELSAVTTDNGNTILYRMWSDGSIDARLVNPLSTQANDWPQSDRAGLSFQEKWKVLQVGR